MEFFNDVFQEVYDRIRCATNARTQTELAAVLEIRQSSISDAKRRNSIPSDWYMKLFEKFGLNPDWIKSGTGPMFLKIDQVYTPVEGPPEGFHEEPAHYADPNAISTLTKVYSTQCAYEEGHPAPDLQTSGKIALPQSYVNAQTLVFHIESDSFSPAGPPRGLMSGWILRVRTPFPAKCTPYTCRMRAWRLSACSSTAIMTVSS